MQNVVSPLPLLEGPDDFLALVDKLGYEEGANFPNTYQGRRLVSKIRGWAPVNKKLVDRLAEYLNEAGKAVELYAGRGELTHWLRDRGVDIDAVDNRTSYYEKDVPSFTEIIDCCVNEFDLSPYSVVIVSWPPADCEWFGGILNAMRPGQHLVFIGTEYQSTGKEEDLDYMFEHFETNRVWDEKINSDGPFTVIPKIDAYDDCIHLLIKK